jgi:hypothetical protein
MAQTMVIFKAILIYCATFLVLLLIVPIIGIGLITLYEKIFDIWYEYFLWLENVFKKLAERKK